MPLYRLEPCRGCGRYFLPRYLDLGHRTCIVHRRKSGGAPTCRERAFKWACDRDRPLPHAGTLIAQWLAATKDERDEEEKMRQMAVNNPGRAVYSDWLQERGRGSLRIPTLLTSEDFHVPALRVPGNNCRPPIHRLTVYDATRTELLAYVNGVVATFDLKDLQDFNFYFEGKYRWLESEGQRWRTRVFDSIPPGHHTQQMCINVNGMAVSLADVYGQGDSADRLAAFP